jgi:hypothetical protein
VSIHDIEERDRVCRLGSEAWKRLQTEQDWNSYMALGEAFIVGREEAYELSGIQNINDVRYKKAFGDWMVKYGLDRFDRSDRAKLFTVMEHRGSIEVWRSTLPLTQRLKLNHPTTVLRKWQKATQVPTAKQPKESPVAKLKQENAELKRQHELDEERLAAAEHIDEAFSLTKDDAEHISNTLVKSVGTKGVTKKKIIEACRLTLECFGYAVVKS